MGDRIISISCVGTGRWTKPEYEMEDTVTLSARTRKGALLRMRLDLVSNRPDVWNYYSLQGTKGAYESGRLFGDKPRIYLEGISKRETWQELEEHADGVLPVAAWIDIGDEDRSNVLRVLKSELGRNAKRTVRQAEDGRR